MHSISVHSPLLPAFRCRKQPVLNLAEQTAPGTSFLHCLLLFSATSLFNVTCNQLNKPGSLPLSHTASPAYRAHHWMSLKQAAFPLTSSRLPAFCQSQIVCQDVVMSSQNVGMSKCDLVIYLNSANILSQQQKIREANPRPQTPLFLASVPAKIIRADTTSASERLPGPRLSAARGNNDLQLVARGHTVKAQPKCTRTLRKSRPVM